MMPFLLPGSTLGTHWNWSPCVHLLRAAHCWYSQIGVPSLVVARQKKCLDRAGTLSRLSLMASTGFFAERHREFPKQRRYTEYA
jgi:hypothetical protein